MSDTDPYAAPDAQPNYPANHPAVINAEAPAATAAPVEVEAAPAVVENPEVPEGSIKTVLAWVGDDKTKAQAALDAEKEGQQRSTLIKELEDILA
jgi:hypothetical protein